MGRGHPKGFHQPHIDPSSRSKELTISFSVYREFFEELLGGQEVEKDVTNVKTDWFLEDKIVQGEPLHWLLKHRDELTLECTGFGFNLKTGNYEFAILLAVHNPEFWVSYGSVVQPNWEAKENLTKLYSTEEKKISQLLKTPSWTDEGLFVFREGLIRLHELGIDEFLFIGDMLQ